MSYRLNGRVYNSSYNRGKFESSGPPPDIVSPFPTLMNVDSDGFIITVVWSENVTTDDTGAVGDYFLVNGAERSYAIDYAGGVGSSTWTFTPREGRITQAEGTPMSVEYTGTPAITDLALNPVDNFADFPVTNDSIVNLPVALFSANRVEPATEDTITFSNESTGSPMPTEALWQFAVSPSTDFNPFLVQSDELAPEGTGPDLFGVSNGTVSIRLTVFSVVGASEPYDIIDYINVVGA